MCNIMNRMKSRLLYNIHIHIHIQRICVKDKGSNEYTIKLFDIVQLLIKQLTVKYYTVFFAGMLFILNYISIKKKYIRTFLINTRNSYLILNLLNIFPIKSIFQSLKSICHDIISKCRKIISFHCKKNFTIDKLRYNIRKRVNW